MDQPLILLTTSEVMTRVPSRAQRKPENVRFTFEDGDTFYTTGRLEAALAEGLCPVVITSRDTLGEHDAWWQGLVTEAGGKLFSTHSGFGGSAFTRYCKEVVETELGLDWPKQEWNGDEVDMFWTNGLRTLNEQQRERL